MTKEGHVVKNLKERYFVIVKNLMVYYKTEEEFEQGDPPTGFHVVAEVTESLSGSKSIITVKAQCGKIFKLMTPRQETGLLMALQRAKEVTAESVEILEYSGHSGLQLVDMCC